MSANIKYPGELDTSLALHCAKDYPKSSYNPAMSKLLRFDAPEDYCDYLETIPAAHVYEGYTYSSYSSAGNKMKQHENFIKQLRAGDLSKVRYAEEVMDKLNREQLLAVGAKEPHLSVVGAMTHFPSYEAGLPNCMINEAPSDIRGTHTPLNIYYDRFGSIGLDTQALTNRGIACLAFVMAMANVRPINVYIIAATANGQIANNSGGLYGSIIRIETQPLDLVRAAHILTSESFTRNLTWSSASYLQAQKHGLADKHWGAYGPFVDTPASGEPYNQSMRHAFQMGKDDIFLAGASVLDELATRDPVAWVAEMLRRHANEEEAPELLGNSFAIFQ